MKWKLKKLTALLLSILMVTSMFTDLLPTARAAEGDEGTPTAENMDADSPLTGRPNLYVDFLGDNNQYRANQGETPHLSGLLTPGKEDQSAATNPGGGNTWAGYQPSEITPGTIFWIGVGIDRMDVLDLFRQDNRGIYSLEVGFYYDNTYIEPYTGGGDYKAVIEAANITNYDHRWTDKYEIITAETGLAPQTDPVTQEVMKKTTIDNIMGETPDGDWKMTYVALERKADSTGDNRFAGIYGGGDEATHYVLLIPFVLKGYDYNHADRYCLRLARNATHLSIGGGTDGADPYAAWERVTVRNENRELKLMANFMGDLDLFDGEKYPDEPYDASLKVNTVGGTGNTAALSITGDPSPHPVRAVKDGDTITGLYGGTGMTLDITCASGYDVEVKVTRAGGDTSYPYATVRDKQKYTFLMPEDSVVVTVTFILNGATDFWVYLDEDRGAETPASSGGSGIHGNDTVISITSPESIAVDKESPTDNPRGLPGGQAKNGVPITIETAVHPDYEAVVELYSEANGVIIPPDSIVPADIFADADGRVTLPAGGTLTLTMPQSDVLVKVKYRPAVRYQAKLEVYHSIGEPVAPVLPTNVAQLTSPVYTDAAKPISAYSGVVYHDDTLIPENHSAVESAFRVLPRVDVSTAAKSGSLGGDREPLSWSGLLDLAAAAADAGSFMGKVIPNDLRQLDVKGTGDGLRKNAAGEFYTGSDIGDFFDRLYALTQLLNPDGTGTALTPAQVQMYLLDYEQDSAAALRSAVNAAGELVNYNWFTPSLTTEPPTAPDLTEGEGAYLRVRGGRQVELVLAADSAYTVQSIVLHDPTGTNADVPVTTRGAGYQNVYSLTMPKYDCVVQVTYALRSVYALELAITGEDGMTANSAALTAYTPDSPGTAARAVTLSAPGTISNVFSGSTVTVKVNKRSGYKVSATVKETEGNSAVTTAPSDISDMANGTVFTFLMPGKNARVEISYTKENVRTNTATILPVGNESSGSTAVWQGTSVRTLYSVTEGTALTAAVNVRPGAYIYSVEVYTETRAYPYTLSGNGWNNGLGGTATVQLVMPGDDVYVRITFKEGPPPAEPELPLSIRVDDPENTVQPLADNWAEAVIAGSGGTEISLGPVGKGSSGGGALTDTKYAAAGDLVTVKLHPATGYHVGRAEVLPASLGAAVTWIDTETVQFIMPAGSASIAVTFAKGAAATWFMDLAKTERDESGGTGSAGNTVDKFTSPTIYKRLGDAGYPVPPTLPQRVPGSDLGVGAATAGETVTLDLRVAALWYIHSLTVTAGGVRLPYDLPDNGYMGGSGGTVRGSFVMPNSDASVTVNYRKGPPPAIKDYQVELAVNDPDNVDDGIDGWARADNYASAVISGATADGIAAVGLLKSATRGAAYAKPGDMVTIDYTAADGFALDIIIVTPAGLRIIPTYLGNNRASFVMPSASVTAEVRFKKGAAARYTADLILRTPGGVAVDTAGEGTFGADLLHKIYSTTAAAGETLDLTLLAKDGYYIRAIEITPAALGVGAGLSGTFGRQSGSFGMPAANVSANVCFEKAWPDEVKYDLTLAVYDGDGSGSAAHFGSIGGVGLAAPDSDEVTGGAAKTLRAAALDRDRVFVAIDPTSGYYASQITVTDGRGETVTWSYASGGVQFDMLSSHVTVAVRFTAGAVQEHRATLHITTTGGAAGTASLSGGSSTVDVDGGSFTVPTGTALTLAAAPGPGALVTAAYAVGASGRQLIVPMTQVTGGGEADFAMPDEDADVYVVFAASGVLSPDDKPATLVVAGPGGSGSAEMIADAPAGTTTGTVPAGSAGTLFAPKDNLITVRITTEPGVGLGAVRVLDGRGADVPYTWTDAAQREFTYQMPATGAAVYVELENAGAGHSDLTAQVVVNDSAYTGAAPSRNNALLRREGEPAASAVKYLTPLATGDRVYLDLTVQPGYVVEEIVVVPARYGIAPSLVLKPNQDQSTSFLMPDGDVVIYVRFAADGRVRKNVTLQVSGTPGVAENAAYIHSDYSGTKGPVLSDKSALVQAGVPTAEESGEWVTVDYAWNADSSVQSVTALDSLGKPVPFTQVNSNQIRFPMVDSSVVVSIVYQSDPTPPAYDANLHVIGLDGAVSAESYGMLTWNGTTTGEVRPGNGETLPVPAGETVTVTAVPGDNTYLKAAYVLYRAGGQMIECNLVGDGAEGFTGTFAMHPGVNDVYVYFTSEEPGEGEYAAVLMLDGVADDTKSYAQMTHSGGSSSALVTVNGDHGYVTAVENETVKVVVVPDAGYTIDYILMTPLGIPITPVRTGNSFTFTMPANNVAARVVLKESGAAEYKATIHYAMAGGAPTNATTDWASLSYTGNDGNPVTWKTNGESQVVPEGAEVTLGVSMDTPNVVLAAYVLKGGIMVALDAALEGTAEGNSVDDDDLTDAAARFTMPGGDVDVYVWYTAAPPTGAWRTAVLTVTDEDAMGNRDSGLNYAAIKSSVSHPADERVNSWGVPGYWDADTNAYRLGHTYLTVTEGETVTVTVGDAAPGYEFQRPATITHSETGAVLGLTQATSTPNYSYTYPVGAFNSAVAVHFKSAAVTQNPLTVVAVDHDNPGDGSVTNCVEVSPNAMDALTLRSTTSAGARQIMPGVKENTAIAFTVAPENDKYLPVATLTSGGTTRELTLARQPGGSYTGSFTMPGRPATLTVAFYQSHEAKLSLVNTADVADGSSLAGMTESSFGGRVTASALAPGQFSGLPGGTVLTAGMERQAEGTRLAAALRIENGSAALLTESGGGYRHTISLTDVEIQMVVAADSAADAAYIVAVAAKDLPTGCPAPTIATLPANPVTGTGWTAAKAGNTITVHVELPDGYRADLTAHGVTLSAASLATSGDVTFPMPANNVQVTVTYVKTKFTATLVTVGSGHSTLDTLADSGTLSGLSEGASLPYTATPNADKVVSAILLTTAGGKTEYLLNADSDAAVNGSFTMPADDVTLTVIFGDTKVTDPEKDLYIATVTTPDTAGLPGNAVQGIVNTSVEDLPEGSPLWAAGYAENVMRVAFTTEPGYSAVVTAKKASDGAVVPVLQQDVAGAGTAYVTMPADDVIITVTYYAGETPPGAEHALTLTLVGHGREAENKAVLSGGTMAALALSGAEAGDLGPVSKTAATAARLGINLDLSADRKSDYSIVKATLTVSGVTTELDLNRYGSNATSLFFMPDAEATVTVYYERVYTATLQIVGASTGDQVAMTDSRTGADTVTASGGQLTDLLGGETISTTATAGPDRELVGVLYSTGTTGAHTVDPVASGSATHEFEMPKEDVLVTAVFQGPDDSYHIAKVTLDPAGDNGAAGNTVGIANKGDPAAPHGPFWTAAENGDGVTVTIGLAAGYQAIITSAVRDDTGADLYISRTRFTAGTTDRTAVFTMPDADATITVKFIKGYTAMLELTDVSKRDQVSTATVTADGSTITGTSDGGDPAAISYMDGKKSISGLADGTPIGYDVTAGTGVTAEVVKTTAGTGTVALDALPGSFDLDGEDATVGVILRSEDDPNDLLAKVVLEGESDVTGNTAAIADLTDPTTTAGTIWTTTRAGNTITVTLTVAKGYVAELRAERDDTHTAIEDLNNGTTTGERVGIAFIGSDDNVSDPQTVTFTMPADGTSDVTVFVKFIYAGTIPAPHDPDSGATGKLAAGWIYGENRGDYAVVTVPTLADGAGDLYDADQYDDTDPGTAVLFRFFLYDKGKDEYTELKEGVDAVLAPYDPDALATPGDPYNYGNYYTSPDGTAYTGARFTIAPLGDSDQAKALGKILDNDGSLDGDGDTVLYVLAQNARAETSAYVQVLVKPYYQLTGSFVSYAPTHEATISLYALVSGDPMDPANLVSGDPMDPANYEETVFAQSRVAEEAGSGLWQQEFSVRSSELDGTYMLVLEKPSHISYTRVNIELDQGALTAGDTAFVIEDVITLIPGDVTGNGSVNLRDRDLLTDYLSGAAVGGWSTAANETEAGWENSIYNPAAEVYRCDLDGDGNITFHDRDIVEDYMNWSDEQYLVDGALPNGLAPVAGAGRMALLSTEPTPEPEPAPGMEPSPESKPPAVPEQADPPGPEPLPPAQENPTDSAEPPKATEAADETSPDGEGEDDATDCGP